MRSITSQQDDQASSQAMGAEPDAEPLLDALEDNLRTGARALFVELPSIANPTEQDMQRSLERTIARARALSAAEVDEAVCPGNSSARTLPTGLGKEYYRPELPLRLRVRRESLVLFMALVVAATAGGTVLMSSGSASLSERLVAALPMTGALVAGILGWLAGHELRRPRGACQEDHARRVLDWHREALVNNCVSVLTVEFDRGAATSSRTTAEVSREKALRVVELADLRLRRDLDGVERTLFSRLRAHRRRHRLRSFMRGSSGVSSSASRDAPPSQARQRVAG